MRRAGDHAFEPDVIVATQSPPQPDAPAPRRPKLSGQTAQNNRRPPPKFTGGWDFLVDRRGTLSGYR
jgi:hypothetical protein